MNPTIHLVVGDIGTGKTTFIDERWPVGTAIRIHFGQILRTAVGIETMKNDPNPNACYSTEKLVRSFVRGALETMVMLNRDVVFDSFPKTPDQMVFLIAECERLPWIPEIRAYRLVTDQQEERIRRRGDVDFDAKRLPHSRRDLDIVTDCLSSATRIQWDGDSKKPCIVRSIETIHA